MKFRKNSDNNIISILSVVSHLDRKKKCIGIFHDIAKAFDTVSHPLLLSKLERIGIRGIALNWFSSYLRNRKQFVSVGDVVSETTNICFGVPQGSILGPTLFIIYLNDIANVLDPLENWQIMERGDIAGKSRFIKNYKVATKQFTHTKFL